MVIVRGNAYDLLAIKPDGTAVYRDTQGYVHFARQGDYRVIESKGLVSV